MKLKPLAGYVLIEAIDERETTASGLVMPEKAKEKPEKGIILEVGKLHNSENGFILSNYNDWLICNSPVKKGDKVVFHKWSGQDIRDGQKEYKLVKFEDLMGCYK